MILMPLIDKPMQFSGICAAWRSPDRTYTKMLVKLDLSCALDAYPGIVIFRTGESNRGVATSVENLERELPAVLAGLEVAPSVYWSLEFHAAERECVLAGLTKSPEFVG